MKTISCNPLGGTYDTELPANGPNLKTMKKEILAIVLCTFLSSLNAQSLVGSWEAIGTFDGKELRNVVIFTEGHQVATFYETETGAFVGTNGGSWSLDGNQMTETIEFDTKTPERVGNTVTFEIEWDNDELRIKDVDLVWKRLDNGTPGDLAGAWLISGRMRNGELQKRDTNRPRKTMKILSGTHFQWIAYNTETKEFMGTGGGTYTTVDGKYTENIEFFSRDNTRVGASLQFDFEIKDGDWHHSGLSSKGQPIYEIWTQRTP
ncbi:membrane or secreted protein [Muricauda sp. SCSIO 64092]|uniref:membrane or secreted protein n=1 Tax=Allomuricauda sp. SCSIO 64092 TaxID=2908842 RepID=UPI001FF20EB0|nr:membrane or secreted protein [Muricauda sp. SCSIO 64092]UOY09172.1 membrane or secreted protein [Muricauda sp. SCSIO 64092]